LRVRLRIAAVGRNACRNTVVLDGRIVIEILICRAVVRARIAEGLIEAGRRAEQFAD
jgi:hypothetical protein